MFKPLSIFIGLRYTAAKRGNHFISFISLVSMLGLMLGVAALIVVLSVMNGFDRELKQRILGMVPHATLSDYGGPLNNWQTLADEVKGSPGLVASAPYIEAQGMLTHSGYVRGVLVNGISPKQESKVSIISQHLKGTTLSALKPGSFNIILGDMLARAIGVGVGDKVTLVLPEASVSVAGVTPRMKRFTVVGEFSVGAQLDGNLAYINIDDGAKLKRYRSGQVDGLRLKFDDLFQAPKLSRQLVRQHQRQDPNLMASDWTRTQGNLFQAIQMEKRMIGLLLFLIVFVAAFNIVSTLVMVVTDKQSDIAILRTMGATPRMIMATFMVQGSVIGVVGTLLGTVLGIILALTVSDIVDWIQSVFGVQFLSPDVYFIDYLPSQLEFSDVSVICIAALAVSFVATLYPAWRASKTQPAEALRYE